MFQIEIKIKRVILHGDSNMIQAICNKLNTTGIFYCTQRSVIISETKLIIDIILLIECPCP